jgi:hypothetical protein
MRTITINKTDFLVPSSDTSKDWIGYELYQAIEKELKASVSTYESAFDAAVDLAYALNLTSKNENNNIHIPRYMIEIAEEVMGKD